MGIPMGISMGIPNVYTYGAIKLKINCLADLFGRWRYSTSWQWVACGVGAMGFAGRSVSWGKSTASGTSGAERSRTFTDQMV